MSTSKANGQANGAYIYDVDELDPDFVRRTSTIVSELADAEAIEHPKISVWEAIQQWPKYVFCIIGNEFCERFNYYGMRAVLIFYLLHIGYDDQSATAIYHLFTVFAYFTPLIGAYLADGVVGKFHVILWVSLIYACGSITLTIASCYPPDASIHPGLDITGLVIIAIGTGGIKPCVAPFGADQFKKGQEALIEPYFAVFYASINAGSLISIFVSPLLYVKSCLNQTTCYPLAFGVPAVLMLCAVIIFVIGSPWYRKVWPTDNIFKEVGIVCWVAIKNKFAFSIKRDHWVEHYLDGHYCNYDEKCIAISENKKMPERCQKKSLVEDIKSLFRVIIMFVPLPLFWCLYDQQGSYWNIQTSEMNYKIGNWSMPPPLMQTINPVFILIFIPIFNAGIYPGLRKCGIRVTPLRRMVTGGFVAALAFVYAGILQLYIDPTLPPKPAAGFAQLGIGNALPCNLSISSPMATESVGIMAYSGYDDNMIKGLVVANDQTISIASTSADDDWCNNYFAQKGTNGVIIYQPEIKFESEKVYVLAIGQTDLRLYNSTLQKSQSGLGDFLINIIDQRSISIYNPCNGSSSSTNCNNYTVNYLFLCHPHDNLDPPCSPIDTHHFMNFEIQTNPDGDGMTTYRTSTDYEAIFPYDDQWEVWMPDRDVAEMKDLGEQTSSQLAGKVRRINNANFTVSDMGGIFQLIIYDDPETLATGYNDTDFEQGYSMLVRLVDDNTISVVYQIPQFIIITAAEILMSITGLEFSYSQAAPSMKSIVQACWLLTTSIGDLITVIVDELGMFEDLAYQLLFFAALMAAVNCIFMALAIFYYKYNYYAQQAPADDEAKEVLLQESAEKKE